MKALFVPVARLKNNHMALTFVLYANPAINPYLEMHLYHPVSFNLILHISVALAVWNLLKTRVDCT